MRMTTTLVLAATALSACAGTSPGDAGEVRSRGAIGTPNPAAEHCIKLGGRLENETGPGGMTAYCVLPDGERVEQWELFRRSAGKPSS